MLKNRILLAVAAMAAVVLVAGVTWYVRRGAEPQNTIDLLERFPAAEKRPDAARFALQDVTITGEMKRGIYAHPHSRIIWKVTLPPDAWLRVSFGMRPDSWEAQGADGAQFRVGVSDGRTYEELLRQYVNPHDRSDDRRWFTATLDLSAYSGETIDVIFNTDPGPPGDANTTADFAVWAQPVIYTER